MSELAKLEENKARLEDKGLEVKGFQQRCVRCRAEGRDAAEGRSAGAEAGIVGDADSKGKRWKSALC